MAIKNLAYTTKQQLESVTHLAFRHSHVIELLAASFGFKSSAALTANHVIVNLRNAVEPRPDDLLLLQSRLVALGYQAVADVAGSVLLQILREHRLGTAAIERVPDLLDGAHWEPDDVDWGDEDDSEQEPHEGFTSAIDLDGTELLMEGLEAAARRGNASAHFALAHIYRRDEHSDPLGSEYWYSLLKQGRPLQGIELEWALAYEREQMQAERHAFHLAEAAKLGHRAARLERAGGGAYGEDGEEDFEEVRQCYLEAAELGDVEAMLELIEVYDQENTKQNWVWVYLSALLGEDLRESSLRAYHDGGMYADEDYDDDQGGPMYVAGHEGVELEPLSAEDDAEAQRLAGEYFIRIDPTGG
ncbi:hypothetical protein [Pseudomonas aeruginosa]|uniref:hypothetical protein n=1 Tax=Pseudomonas aeruginosa TaxID=287 RepID=UPI0029C0AC52|nr:hypothetical protein [Pseudomonas aeruginosa]